jgi:hypothetical protein
MVLFITAIEQNRDHRESPWADGPRASHENPGADFAFCGARLQACRWLTLVTVVSTFFSD